MTKLSGKEIQKLARSIVAENPGGIRYSELVERISHQTPETPRNTIHGSVWNLDTIFPNEIAKPSRGLFTPIAKPGNETADLGSAEQIAPSGVKVKESEFYQPFADWLKNDLDEVTECRVLDWIALSQLSAAAVGALAISAIMLLAWVFFFTKTSLRSSAFSFAETLLRTCDTVQ